MKNRILIAGGAGFIGSHLCHLFISKGFTVDCIDNLYSGFESNIKEFFPQRNFRFIKQDIIDPINGNYDFILNFACPASPPRYQMDPIFTLKTNVIGTLNLLELARKCGAIFLQASTSEIYGNPEVHPQPESYVGHVNPIGIRSCYDEGKRAAETLCFDFQRKYQIDARVIRIFNTYGPKMDKDDGRVVSNFITQALAKNSITIYGAGNQTRSFCYISDLIAGIETVLNAPRESISGPFNLGRDQEFTVTELATLVLKITKSSSNLVYKPLPSDDPVMRRPDLSKIKKVLGWEPKISLEEGLQHTIAYFQRSTRSI